MTIAQLPDGTQLNFPDETDPSVIQATVKKVLGQQVQAAPAPQGPAPYVPESPLGHLFDGKFIETMQKNAAAQGAASDAKKAAQDAADKTAATAQHIPTQDEKDWQAVQGKPLLDRLPFYAKLGGSAIVRGLASLPAAAADAGVALNEGRGNSSPGDASQIVSNIGTQPQTGPQRYASSGIQGATGAVASPGGLVAPIRAAIAGTSAGLAGHAAGEATKDQSPEIQALASTLAGLAGGAATGVAMAPKTTRADLINTATRDTNPAELQAARDRMQATVDSGQGSINASQAMTQPSGIDKLVNVLANSKNGQATQAQLRAQPAQVALSAEDAVNQLPGNQGTPHDSANAVQSAATDVIQNSKDARTQLWQDTLNKGVAAQKAAAQGQLQTARQAVADLEASRDGTPNPRSPGYRQVLTNLTDAQAAVRGASQVPGDAVVSEATRIRDLANARPNTAAGSLLGKLSNQLMDANGRPLTDPTQINDALKTMASSLKDPNLGTPGVDAGTVNYLQSQIAQIRNNLGARFQPIKDANDAFSAYTDSVVNPLKQSVTGRMSGVAGYDPAKEAPITKVQSLFDKGTVPGGPSDILTLEKSLRTTDGGPQTFQDAFKTWVRGKLSSSLTGDDNRTPENVASTLTKVFGDPDQATTQSQGTKDMLVGLARSQGLSAGDQTALVNGFAKMQRFAAAASRRPGSVGDSTSDLRQASAGGSQEGLRDNVSSALFGVRRAISDLRSGDALRFADRLVTTPEGMDTLIKMAKEPTMSQATANAITTLVGTATAQSSNQTPGP